MYRTDFSDIHCGMRGITTAALKRMRLSSQSWEYASEMLIKAVHMGLRRAEVPITFHKEPEGRTSHHVRIGWFSPWLAGWENLRAMFVFGADFFLWWPGIVLMVIGVLLLGILANGPVHVGSVTLSLNSMLLGLLAALTGLQMFLAGVIVKVLTDGRGLLRTRWGRIFSYTRTTVVCAVLGVIGTVLLGRFIALYVRSDYLFPANSASASLNHQAVIGMFLIVAGLIVFTHMLIIQAIRYYVRDRRPKA
jgi:hypothetical protein